MSNRRQPGPPAGITAAARAYTCSDCTSETGRPWRDRDGLWHIPVHHDPGCPQLAGTIPTIGDLLRCAQAAGAAVILTRE